MTYVWTHNSQQKHIYLSHNDIFSWIKDLWVMSAREPAKGISSYMYLVPMFQPACTGLSHGTFRPACTGLPHCPEEHQCNLVETLAQDSCLSPLLVHYNSYSHIYQSESLIFTRSLCTSYSCLFMHDQWREEKEETNFSLFSSF